jgi:hypothetical protein
MPQQSKKRIEEKSLMNNHFNKRGRNNHQRRRQGANPNRALDSNGPDVRIRGTAQQIYDKYVALARDATSSGDRVKTENYLQHAEHYFRVLRSIQGPQAQPADQSGDIDSEVDGDQPSIGDQRDQRQPESRSEASDANAPASAEPADAAPSGADLAQGERAAVGNDPESRRRRRPRRPREEGESAAGDGAAPEPVAAD